MPKHHTARTLAALLIGAGVATAAKAGDFSNASNYNAPWGMSAGQENQAATPSLRDSNGNLNVVNGQFTTANFGTSSGVSATSTGASSMSSGAGTSGATSTIGTATAIGNQLHVVTLGSNNTVVVNAVQTNNGNQTATNTVNGQTQNTSN